nr:MAG TPA: hypothetical protein [Caudoviricetes sp.]
MHSCSHGYVTFMLCLISIGFVVHNSFKVVEVYLIRFLIRMINMTSYSR